MLLDVNTFNLILDYLEPVDLLGLHLAQKELATPENKTHSDTLYPHCNVESRLVNNILELLSVHLDAVRELPEFLRALEASQGVITGSLLAHTINPDIECDDIDIIVPVSKATINYDQKITSTVNHLNRRTHSLTPIEDYLLNLIVEEQALHQSNQSTGHYLLDDTLKDPRIHHKIFTMGTSRYRPMLPESYRGHFYVRNFTVGRCRIKFQVRPLVEA